jgi:hypothetical protein
VINKIKINNPNATNPSHGEMAKTTPPVVDTPFPPLLILALLKSNFVLNNMQRYCSGQQ